MKVLLTAINAKYIHSGLAVYCLRANASEFKENIEIKEYTINNRVEDILQEIYKSKPDILAFSCYIWNIEYVKMLVVEIAKILPDTHIWLGGPEVSYNATKILNKYIMIKGIMIGEGECTFHSILKCYSDCSLELSSVNGIIFRSDNNQIFENRNIDVLDLNELNFAYSDLNDFENRIIYYESSRGCPFSCSYCLSSIDKKLRLRNYSKVKNELKFFLDNKVKQVKFIDRTFNANKEHAMQIWRYLFEMDNGITNFHFEISADLLDEQQLELLSTMRKGLVQFEIGVQTTNRQTIKEIDRIMNLNKLTEAVKKIKASGNIHQHLDLIAGLPYEDYKSFSKSFNDVYEMQPEQLQLGFLKVLHGSKMFDFAEVYGLVYQSMPPYEVLYTNWLSFGDVCKLKAIEEVLEIYYNSGQFTNTIKCLVRLFENPFSMYENLSCFINEKDRFIKHSRINYYTLLLEFVKTIDNSKEEIYREILTYDLYLRENMKSRPPFANNMEPFKNRIKDFYKIESKEFKYLKHYDSYTGKQIANMTHIEVFNRDIKLLAENGIDNGQTTYVLYDYNCKDILTNRAETINVLI